MWFISTLGRLTIGKTVTDLLPLDHDPADDVRDSAEFQFDVTFTLPGNISGTSGDESKYFGTGPYSVKYTLNGEEEPQTMALDLADGKYTGTLTLKNGQSAMFDLPDGATYTVREKDYDPDGGIIDFKLTEINGEPADADDSATGTITAATNAAAQFTNAPTGVVIEKAQAGGDFDPSDIMHVGSGETVTYTITVYNYDVADKITVEDDVPDADGEPGHRKLRVHTTSFDPDADYAGEEGTPEQAPGSDYGGVVTWRDLEIPAGSKQDLTFKVSTPIVMERHTYTNSATATWDGGTADSNAVTMTVYEDWLRIGKIAVDTDGRTPIAPDEDFTFTLTLWDESGSGRLQESYSYVWRTALGYEDMGIELPTSRTLEMTGDSTTKTGTFTLKAGQAITIYGIAPGVKYKVEETEADDYSSSEMTPRNESTVIGTDGYGTISSDANDWVYFTNTRKSGDLTVSKTLGGSYGETDKAWTFTVTLGDNTITGDYGGMTFTNGVATFTLKAVDGGGDEAASKTFTFTVTGPNGYSEMVTITGSGSETLNDLPVGTYTVAENSAGAAVKGYELTVTGEGTAEVTLDATTDVTVTNTYTSTTGGLTVTKTVTGSGDKDKEWHFILTLTPPDGETLDASYPCTGPDGPDDLTVTHDGDSYTAEFTLKDGQSITITGLPKGTKYEVTETEENADGYATTYNGQAGEITADVTAEVTVVNDKPDEPEETPRPSSTSVPQQSGGDGGSAPSTGDESEPALWAALAGGCTLALAVVAAVWRRRKRT